MYGHSSLILFFILLFKYSCINLRLEEGRTRADLNNNLFIAVWKMCTDWLINADDWLNWLLCCYLTISLRARVFYEQIVKEAQLS